MIKDENKEDKRVSWKTFTVYNNYLGGWGFFSCMMMVQIARQVLLIMGDYYLSDWTHKGPNAQQQMFGFYSTITFLIILASLLAYLVNYLGMIYKSLGLS